MSIFATRCTVTGILLCYSIVYVAANSRQLEQLGHANAENKTVSLPNSFWGQLAFRGMFFALGSIFFAVCTAIMFLIIAVVAGPFENAELALLLSSWLGGLCCTICIRSGGKISYWTAWALQIASAGGV